MVLFLSIWGTVVPLFGMLAVLPTLPGLLAQSGLLGLDGNVSADLAPDKVNALLTASSGTTLAIAAATARRASSRTISRT